MKLGKILIVGIITILIGSNMILYKKLYEKGSDLEKYDLLTQTVFQLINDGKTHDDIEKINVMYDSYKGGNFPYQVYVTIKSEPYVQIYTWSDSNKNSVELIGHTGAINKAE